MCRFASSIFKFPTWELDFTTSQAMQTHIGFAVCQLVAQPPYPWRTPPYGGELCDILSLSGFCPHRKIKFLYLELVKIALSMPTT